MRLFLALFLTTFFLKNIESREYHYDKPATPFYTGASHQGPTNYRPPAPPAPPHGHIQLPTVVRTLGPAGREFEVYGMSSSRQVFESRHHPQTPAAALHPPPAPATPLTTSYLPPSTRVDLTVRVNPFNQIVSVTKGGTLGGFSTAASAPAYSAPAYHHGAASGPAPLPTNPQQYAAAYSVAQQGAAHGQQGARGFQGPQAVAGGFSAQAGGAGQTAAAGPFGNYIAQSEVGQLDVYAHQQQGGVARPFDRVITTCYPNGQCERTSLAPGQSDPRHQHVVLASRARTQPVSNKCQRIAAAGTATTYAAPPVAFAQSTVIGGQIVPPPPPAGTFGPTPGVNYGPPPPPPTTVQPARPNNRRLYPYTETVRSSDGFN